MKKYKIGVFGAGRGIDIAYNFKSLGCEIVAVCEFNKDRQKKEEIAREFGAKVYDNFDEFIEVEMDAMIVANYFNEHAPYAIKCFEKNIHVFSECISNGTMAEGVELLEAFKHTKSIYMLAENYPQMIFNREMKRICDEGTLGKIAYAEGEYNHPISPYDDEFLKVYTYYEKHWRNFLPKTYYITHSLGPVMWLTGATPKKVTAYASFSPLKDDEPTSSYTGDIAAVVMTHNDDESVFRLSGFSCYGGHNNTSRLCGVNGQVESVRGSSDKIMLRYNPWSIPEGKEEVNFYEPQWHDKDEEKIKESGHGGSDYLTARYFLECIEKNQQPEKPFDIYSAVIMSSVAILAHRSVLEGGKSYDIPDLTKKEWIDIYKDDRLTPFYGADGSEPTLPCCSHTDYKPLESQKQLVKELLKK